MKYLFINVVAGSGSTGRIAAEQCRKLQEQGYECILAYGRWESNCEGVKTHRIGTSLDYRVHGLLTRLFDFHGFGSKRATREFLRWVKEYDPDVIWLHNIHGYYLNIELLFEYLKTCGKTIRWTLHDCWVFTGHCSHFSYVGCEQWKTECSKCVQLKEYPKCMGLSNVRRNFARKKLAFTNVPNLTLITPCCWLADQVRQSFLRDYPVEVEYNKIDTTVFQPTQSDFREKYGLQNKTVLLGVASKWSERKGLQDQLALIESLGDTYRLVLVGVSEEEKKGFPAKVLGILRTENARQLAEIYTAADYLINTSYEETYPTVNLEAQACGTHVMAYDVGGTKETIKTTESYLVPVGRYDLIKARLEQKADGKAVSGEAR